MDSAALTIKREIESGNIVTLSTGVRAILRPVAPYLLDAVARRFKNPEPPMVDLGDGRTEPNPGDPQYLMACEVTSAKQAEAVMEAFYIFGVELVDPIPEGFEKKLTRMGIEFNADDPDERELAYKKYIAMGGEDIKKVQALAGLSREGVREAEKTF